VSSWVEIASRELEINITNRGICGDLSGDMLRRFPQDVFALNPTHVIILGGTNDAFARVPLSTVAANFTAMITACSNHQILLIFGLPIPSLFPAEEAYLTDYREWLESYAKVENIPLIDFYTPFTKKLKNWQPGELILDRVHPSLTGYRLMAAIAVEALKGL
jgi:acyl-CoA thioesterase I